MGSWNGTCGISNLPIQSGDKVLLFVLAKSKAFNSLGGGFSYPTDVYTPVGIPVHGSYNDYGTIEDITENGEVMFEYLTNHRQYKYKLNEGVDITPTNITEVLGDVIERGESNYYLMLVRKDVLDSLKAQDVSGYSTFAPQFAAFSKVYHDEINRVKTEEADKYHPILHNSLAETNIQFNQESDNEFADLLFMYEHYPVKPMLRKALTEHTDELERGVTDILYVNELLGDLRKFWTMQSGGGNDHDAHLALCSTIQDVCAERDLQNAE